MIAVILSGGSGTRLWPVSRKAHPKPFMPMPDGRNLLQHTMERVTMLPGVKHVLTLTNRDYYFQSRDAYADLALDTQATSDFLLEPCARNTAPAVAMAAMHVADRFSPESILLIMPADHVIAKTDRFAEAVVKAKKAAEADYLVTFGIQPTRAETGFGYLAVGDAIPLEGTGTDPDVARVSRFVEKPNPENARRFFESNDYLWNAGMFCFKARTFLAALKETAPELHNGALACWNQTAQDQTPLEMNQKRFAELPGISVDYAVMEKASRVAVVRCDIGWNDVGSWTAVGAMFTPDTRQNRIDGDAILIESRNCFIRTEENRLVATVGVNDLIIVDTADAILIADRNHDQEVKQVVDHLRKHKHEAHLFHQTVYRPWGTFTLLEKGESFKIKRIEVKPGAALSLQMHYHRNEHWVVVSGTARILNGDEEILLKTNESTYIPAGHKHRLENPGKVKLILIEVQSGEYLGEDDIVRFEDIYGRAQNPI